MGKAFADAWRAISRGPGDDLYQPEPRAGAWGARAVGSADEYLPMSAELGQSMCRLPADKPAGKPAGQAPGKAARQPRGKGRARASEGQRCTWGRVAGRGGGAGGYWDEKLVPAVELLAKHGGMLAAGQFASRMG